MKIKNSKESLRLSMLFPVMYVMSLVLIVLRCFQLTRFIDSETGFVTGGAGFNVLLYVLIGAVSLFFIAVSFLSADVKKLEIAGMKDKAAAIAAVVFGAALMYDWIDSLVEGVVIFNDISFVGFYSGGELFKTLMSTGALPYMLQGLFALASAIYVFILAKSFFNGSMTAHKHRYLALAPVAWTAFKLITRFVKQISYIKVSDLMLELIMLAFMILFFVAFSQVVSGVYSDTSRWRITALGLSGAVVSLCANVPRLIFTLFANEFLNKEYPFNFADAAFAFFAVFVALAACKKSSTAD